MKTSEMRTLNNKWF